MYNHKFVWPYFKQIDLIFPALVFAYELQSPSKVCDTNSYVTLKICMTILQTASLCCWQHHFLAYEHGYLWKYLIRIPIHKHKFVWPYFKQIDLIFPALVFLHTNCIVPQKYEILIPMFFWKFVWLSFKQLVCVAGSIIFCNTIIISIEVWNIDSNAGTKICMNVFSSTIS